MIFWLLVYPKFLVALDAFRRLLYPRLAADLTRECRERWTYFSLIFVYSVKKILLTRSESSTRCINTCKFSLRSSNMNFVHFFNAFWNYYRIPANRVFSIIDIKATMLKISKSLINLFIRRAGVAVTSFKLRK